MTTILRIAILVAILAPLAAPPAQADLQAETIPKDDLTAIGVHDASGTLLAWAPTPTAHFYTVYRGSSPTELKPIATVAFSAYEDQAAPDTTAYYAIGIEGELPGMAFAVQGEGCVSFMMSPPSVNTHLDSCVGP